MQDHCLQQENITHCTHNKTTYSLALINIQETQYHSENGKNTN